MREGRGTVHLEPKVCGPCRRRLLLDKIPAAIGHVVAIEFRVGRIGSRHEFIVRPDFGDRPVLE